MQSSHHRIAISSFFFPYPYLLDIHPNVRKGDENGGASQSHVPMHYIMQNGERGHVGSFSVSHCFEETRWNLSLHQYYSARHVSKYGKGWVSVLRKSETVASLKLGPICPLESFFLFQGEIENVKKKVGETLSAAVRGEGGGGGAKFIAHTPPMENTPPLKKRKSACSVCSHSNTKEEHADLRSATQIQANGTEEAPPPPKKKKLQRIQVKWGRDIVRGERGETAVRNSTPWKILPMGKQM